MSTQLIPVFTGEISNTPQPLCDARELFKFLEITYNFGTWIGNRIRQYQFVENTDYCSFTKICKRTTRGASSLKQYHLTLDMAKELAMVERNQKGREARRYFIECERRLQQGLQPADNNTMQALQSENTELKQQLGELQAHSQALQTKYTGILEYKVAQLEQQASPTRKRKASPPISDSEKQIMRDLHAQGLSLKAIAKETGRSSAAISFIVRGAA